MNRLKRKLKSPNLWLNFFGALIVSAGLVFLIFKSFEWFTNHGNYIDAPNLVGKPSATMQKIIKQNGLRFEVVDSVYNKDMPPGSVISQQPAAGQNIKKGRKIYITLNANAPPKIKMPDLINLSLNHAIAVLQAHGLKFGKQIVKPGLPPVMAQRYQGMPISPGTNIAKGSTIDLVVGAGRSTQKVIIPELIGLTRVDAIKVIAASMLNLGVEIYPNTAFADTNALFVVRQSPGATTQPLYNNGSTVDIWLSPQKPPTDEIPESAHNTSATTTDG